MILQGPRISIRPIAWDDLTDLCRWLNDPTVMREVRAERLRPELEQIQEQSWPVWRDPAPGEYHEFIIWLGEKRIGEIGYIFENLDQGTVSVDIKIGEPSLWGKGLGTEAMKLLVSYLFDQMNAQHIIAIPGDWNTRSMRMFGKCGFKEIGREETPANSYYDGGIAVIMQLDKEMKRGKGLL